MTATTAAVPDLGELAPPDASPAVRLESVTVTFGNHVAVRDVTLDLPVGRVTALVGPSGCGKTTLLRTVNRMHERTGGRVSGRVHLGDLDVYGPGVRAELVRARVGMVFQRPNPFPTMSVFDNAVSGLRFYGIRSRSVLAEAAESSLRAAGLWDAVKDRLQGPAVRLSGGQQQRLCIARALAVEPEVLLMDEPCSSLDPVSTAQIEELIRGLIGTVTIGLVTHNMFQAQRVADRTAVFLPAPDGVGELAEIGPTAAVFTSPRSAATQAYISGQVG